MKTPELKLSNILILLLFFSSNLWGVSSVSGADTTPLLDKTSFLADGLNQTLLHIQQPGAYSIQVKSQQGTRIALIDRMAGIIASNGSSGSNDGRIDTILDTGTYKLRLWSPQNGEGEAKLSVFMYKEATPKDKLEQLPVLKEHKLIHKTLADLEQQSYWLQVENRSPLILEAQGRNLSSCALWKNGNWLTDSTPSISTYEPIVGQPMKHVELYQQVEPGLYLLRCYGGEPLAWANETGEHPFYLRMGIPTLSSNGIKFIKISPFGRDFFLLPGSTNLFQVTRDDKKDTTLSVKNWSAGQGRFASSYSQNNAEINKKSRSPWCTIRRSGDKTQLVMIKAKPGDDIRFTHFREASDSPFSGNNYYRNNGQFWISAVESEEGVESLDFTGILYDYKSKKILRSKVLEIGGGLELERKINLLGNLSAIIKVNESGSYHVVEDPTLGGKGEYTFKPLLDRSDRKRPNQTISGSSPSAELVSGYYRLNISPESKGILHFNLKESGMLDDVKSLVKSKLLTKLNLNKKKEITKQTGNIKTSQGFFWPKVDVYSPQYTSFIGGQREGVHYGFVVRELPLDLKKPLPMVLAPGQTIEFPVRINRQTRLEVGFEKGRSIEIKAKNKTVSNLSSLPQGEYTVKVTNTGTIKSVLSLGTFNSVVESIKPSKIADIIAKSDHKYTVLTDKAPLYRKFERQEQKTFILKVDKPGLYRFETSGRMETALTVRTKTILSLFNAQSNGVGRNALVQQYLKPGDYKVTIQTRGKSRGWAGIHLKKSPLHDLGVLVEGGTKRVRLKANEAVRYKIDIKKYGEYHIQTLGLNKEFTFRFDDAEGWPLVQPQSQGNLSMYLWPGIYYYYSLPAPLLSRRITNLYRQVSVEKPVGKGPHSLAFNRQVSHTWRETHDNRPDIYHFNVPAEMEVNITLTKDFEARLRKKGDKEWSHFTLKDKEYWGGTFQAGDYVLHVKSIEKNDRASYSVQVLTPDLAPGLSQTVSSFPKTLKVKVGKDSMIELYSQGTTDIKAQLEADIIDDSGDLVGENDDRENDWNFSIFKRLKEGSYVLKLDKITGSPSGSVTIRMRELEQQSVDTKTIPFKLEKEIGDSIVVIPFKTSDNGIYGFSTHSASSLGLAILKNKNTIAEGQNELYVPLAEDSQYELLAWSYESSNDKTVLNALRLPDKQIRLSNEKRLKIDMPANKTSVFKVFNPDFMSYRIDGDQNLMVCPGLFDVPCKALTDYPVSFENGNGWLVSKRQSNSQQSSIIPLELKTDEIVSADLRKLPLYFNVTKTNSDPVLIQAESFGTIIGMSITEAGKEKKDPNWFGMHREKSLTLTSIIGDGEYKGRIWLTDPELDASRVAIRMIPFSTQPIRRLNQSGLEEGTINVGTAKRFKLENKEQMLDITLSKGLAASVFHKGMNTAMLTALNDNLNQRVKVAGGVLTVFNSNGSNALFRIEHQSKAGNNVFDMDSDEEIGFENVFFSTGKLYLRVKDVPKNHDLFAAGDKISGRYLMNNGLIRQFKENEEISVPKPVDDGILEIDYQSGYVQVWHGKNEERQESRLSKSSLPSPDSLSKGSGIITDKVQRWSLEIDQLTYLTVTVNSPGATFLMFKDKVMKTGISYDQQKRTIEAFLQPGAYHLVTRPIKGLKQSGEIIIKQATPIVLKESDEPAISRLIRPGEFHVFSFAVNTKGAKVGVGAKMEYDSLDVKLYDPTWSYFQPKEEGPLIFEKLSQTTYYLVVSLRGSFSNPVMYKPFIYGTTGSLKGIPQNILKKYRQDI